ncbi:hypothetical protein ACLB1R_01700 [Escherichia coli]
MQKLSSQLQYILATSRFAHYLKVIVRDKVGSFMSKTECQTYLQWIMQYVVASDNAGQEQRHVIHYVKHLSKLLKFLGVLAHIVQLHGIKPHFQLEG